LHPVATFSDEAEQYSVLIGCKCLTKEARNGDKKAAAEVLLERKASTSKP
jgi:hypothetical protein